MEFPLSKLISEHDNCFIDKAAISVKANDERGIFNKLTSLLSGIPPPPAIATSKLTCNQMLESIKLNIDILEFQNVDHPLKECNPRVFYLNKDILSEEIAELTMKLQSRYVQSETASSYSIQSNIDRQLSNSARKKRQWNGISPGRRLSHLARRRQMFSKANLQQLSKNEPKVHRIAISKPLAQRNLAKEYLEYKDNASKDKNLPKRALFQSPEDEVLPGFRTVARNVPRRKLFEKPERSAQLPVGGGSYDVSGWLATQPFLGGKKRSRDESRDSDRKRRCPRRSLDFSDGSPSQCSDASALSNVFLQAPPPPTNVPLTQVQKQKLLWAVAVVLKEKKITHKDSRFKNCATTLFTICKKNLPLIMSLAITAGTSEKMLTYARSKVDEVVKNFEQKSEPIPTTSKAPGILHDLSSSTLNKKLNDSQGSNIMDGKENVTKTPKRKKKIRQWQTCIKSINKRKSRLHKSLSFDDLREINKKQLNVNINETLFKFCINSPLKIKTPAKRKHAEAFNLMNSSTDPDGFNNEAKDTSIIPETPDKNNGDCIPGSQEELETHNFPALSRNLCIESKTFCERSPDLFEPDDDYPDISQAKADSESINVSLTKTWNLETIENLNCTTTLKDHCLNISSVLLEKNSSTFELSECEESINLPVEEVLINNELLSSAILETNNNQNETGNDSFLECNNFVVDKKLIDDHCITNSPNVLDAVESVVQILDLNKTNLEANIIIELPTLFAEVELNENNLSPLQFEKDNIINVSQDNVKPRYSLEKIENIDMTHKSENSTASDEDVSKNNKTSEDPDISHTTESKCKNMPLLSQDELNSKSDLETDDSLSTSDESSINDLTNETSGKPDYCFMNDSKAEFSIIEKGNEDSFVDVIGDGTDKTSPNVCTSTPLVEFPKKLMIKSKPAWRLEAGPGLKIRMRLSKDWDIVGRRDSHASDSSEAISYENNIDIDMESKPAETRIDNSLMRKICNGESSGTSMDSYTLTEMRDRLAIEKTLGAENSDLSLFDSDSEISSRSESNESSENTELLRNGGLDRNSSFSKDSGVQHHSFESIIESAALERKQDVGHSQSHSDVLKSTENSLSLQLSAAFINPTLEMNNMQGCDLSIQKLDAMRSSIVDNVFAESPKVGVAYLPLEKSTLPTCSDISMELLDLNDENNANSIQTPLDDFAPLIQHVSEPSETSLNEVNLSCNEIQNEFDEDDVPLIQLVTQPSVSLNGIDESFDKTNDICKDDSSAMQISFDNVDVAVVKLVPEELQSILNPAIVTDYNAYDISNDESSVVPPSFDDDDVPLIKFVSESSQSAIADLYQHKSVTDTPFDKNIFDDKKGVDSSRISFTCDVFNNESNAVRPFLDEDDVPLIQFVSESSRSAIVDLNQSMSEPSFEPSRVYTSFEKNNEIVNNICKESSAVRIPFDDDDVPFVKLVPEESQAIFKPAITTDDIAYDISNKESNVARPSFDEDDVPLIQFVSESSRSAIADLYQPKAVTDISSPFFENIFDDKKVVDSSRISLDENVPSIKFIPESSKSGLTNLVLNTLLSKSSPCSPNNGLVKKENGELYKNKTNVMRPSFDDDLPLIYLLPESSKENNLLELLQPQGPSDNNNILEENNLSEINSFSDDDRPVKALLSDRPNLINYTCHLDVDDDDVPLSQLADNSTSASKMNNELICKEKNSLLIQLKNENCDAVNNNESYDPTKKYDLLLNQLNQSVLTENSGDSNILDTNNSISSSGAEDTPLCNLISQNGNDKIASNDVKYLKRQSSEEDENTPLVELTKSKNPSNNLLNDKNKSLGNEIRHFKDISIKKNKIESNYVDKSDLNVIENNYQTPSKESTVSESTTDSRLIPMSASSDTSTGKSKNKLSLESYKARKRLILEPNIEEVSPPKKIYNIRLKKKERHSKKGERRRSSLQETSNENWDEECRDDSDNIDKLFIDKAKTFVNAFSTISCMVDQEMKLTVSAIADDKERERKLRKLSDVSEMSENILQAFFDQIPKVKGIFTSDS